MSVEFIKKANRIKGKFQSKSRKGHTENKACGKNNATDMERESRSKGHGATGPRLTLCDQMGCALCKGGVKDLKFQNNIAS